MGNCAFSLKTSSIFNLQLAIASGVKVRDSLHTWCKGYLKCLKSGFVLHNPIVIIIYEHHLSSPYAALSLFKNSKVSL